MKRISYLLIILILGGCADFNESDISSIEDYDNYLLEEMEDQRIPALSVLIFRDTSVLLERNLGKSHIRQNIDLESDHLFLLASISKVITATALLQLKDQGLLSLEDKINDYLPFEVLVPGQSTDITFKMLLTHTSSIRDGSAMDDQYYYDQDPANTLDYFLTNYLIPGGIYYNASENFYNSQPGTRYKYSNEGNALIGLLVEYISGMDFNDYCKQNIFRPLGMTHTYWRLDEIEQNGAFIVQPYEHGRWEYEEIQHYTFTDYPNGGLRSTCTDLFFLLKAFINEGVSNGYQLLDTETVDQMVTPQIPVIDDEQALQMFLIARNKNLWGHDGGELGVSTIMAFNPDTETGVIVLANEGNAYLDNILKEGYKIGITQ